MNATRAALRSCSVLASLLGFAATGRAQSLDWSGGFHRPGLDGRANVFTEFDDGSGKCIIAAGDFRRAGTTPARSIARWDGTDWHALGPGVVGQVWCLQVFDDGSGPALYVGGDFSIPSASIHDLARWDGSTWSVVGGASITSNVAAMTVHDDGSGPALFVGGEFTHIGGVPANNVAKWDGAFWNALGAGVNFGIQEVRAMTAFDGPGGSVLVVGGDFISAGGAQASHLAQWDGQSWAQLGGGVSGGNATVHSLLAHGNAPNQVLFVGGTFTTAGFVPAENVAAWDGSAWSAAGQGVDGAAVAMRWFQGELYVSGLFGRAGGLPARSIARWNGSRWAGLGLGVDGLVTGIGLGDDGSGLALYAGGLFDAAGRIGSHCVARWRDHGWSPLSEGHGLSDRVESFASADFGGSSRLYVAGRFLTAGVERSQGVAIWDGLDWAPVDPWMTGFVDVLTFASNAPGGGPRLFAGGSLSWLGQPIPVRVASWNGLAWSTLGPGPDPDGFVDALLVSQVGSVGTPSLYIGGGFANAGGQVVNSIVRWDGATYHALTTGTANAPFQTPAVRALAEFDDGSGLALYVGGHFTIAGGSPANRIAKWDGTTWSPLGQGLEGNSGTVVLALVVYDDGSGPALYAGGQFALAGGVPAEGLARWDGATWTVIPGLGAGSEVTELVVHDDGTGSGPGLYVGGSLITVGSRPLRWDSTGWSTLGTGTEFEPGFSGVKALASYSVPGSGHPSLFVGGGFQYAGVKRSDFIAEWTDHGSVGTRFCAGDGVDPAVLTPCPCNNWGALGHGCAGQSNPQGGLVTAFGSTAVDPTSQTDTVELLAENLPQFQLAIFLQGSQEIVGAALFGNGLRCAGGTLIRLGTKTTTGMGGARFPEPTDPSLSHRGGVTPGSGQTRYYQCWYRDLSVCQPGGFNISNAVRILW